MYNPVPSFCTCLIDQFMFEIGSALCYEMKLYGVVNCTVATNMCS